MFKGMEGTSMGIWVAHGEGQALFPDSSILQRVTDRKLAALRYVHAGTAIILMPQCCNV
jgi:phosphoribosylformylglycinamidine synthase